MRFRQMPVYFFLPLFNDDAAYLINLMLRTIRVEELLLSRSLLRDADPVLQTINHLR